MPSIPTSSAADFVSAATPVIANSEKTEDSLISSTQKMPEPVATAARTTRRVGRPVAASKSVASKVTKSVESQATSDAAAVGTMATANTETAEAKVAANPIPIDSKTAGGNATEFAAPVANVAAPKPRVSLAKLPLSSRAAEEFSHDGADDTQSANLPMQPQSAFADRSSRSFRDSRTYATGSQYQQRSQNQPGSPSTSANGYASVNNGYANSNGNGYGANQTNREEQSEVMKGILDMSRDGHGVLRAEFSESEKDAYISSSQIRRFKLRPGDVVTGRVRIAKDNERYRGLLQVDLINDLSVEEFTKTERVKFKTLTPVYPDSQLKLEIGKEPLSLRIIDLVAPIGRGQRSLIVSPPKAGKTTLLKNIATGVASNYPDIHIMAVLVGERPEEVTDIRRHIAEITKGKGEVAASNFDESAQDQVRVAELALERAKRLVELGQDVLIVLDSITRLARAYNLAMPTSGRTLSGGFDPAALFPPKKFFGAARNFEVPGSLTIVGTALVDTGSRMDDLVYEEFKGTGNQEVVLERRLAERRIFPAIDVQKSGTRRDDLLIEPMTYQAIATLHRMLDTLDKEERSATMISQMKKTNSNKDFLNSLKVG